MPKQGKAAVAVLLAAAATGAVLALSPVASAGPDGGVCARLNGVPFYIPPEGYMPKPGEVITGPVHAGPCPNSPNSPAPNSPAPKSPNLPTPQAPNTPSSSTTEPPAEPNP
jgi:hypothetical protein